MPRNTSKMETTVIQTATARQAQAMLGVATRFHGPDSPEAHAARRTYRTARLCSQILAIRAELDGFVSTERNALFAALDGREVSVSA